MIPLVARGATVVGAGSREATRVLRIVRTKGLPGGVPREALAQVIGGEGVVPGVGVHLYLDQQPVQVESGVLAGNLPRELGYLTDGDVIAWSPSSGSIRVLYRRASPNNSFLVTERCDNYCVMCSQPPKDVNDDWLVKEIVSAIPLISTDTAEIGFTGGEPTLLGDVFLGVLALAKERLPTTALHVLSNGRRFADIDFAKSWANLAHPDLMVGIPLYSDLSTVHDYVVQADGAYDETVRGILNLKKLRQRVEIRVVLHRETIDGLHRLAEFIARNLLFVDHVALMGLEIMGFARANLEQIWIDPNEYRTQLAKAVEVLDGHGLRVSIYNHQLCVIDRELWPFAVRSISDWKNEYLSECDRCSVKVRCGGFFHSAKFRRSRHIRAL